MKKRIANLHKRAEKEIKRLAEESVSKLDFDAVISVRTTQDTKKAFFDVCNNNLTTPRKYVTGNVLRRFIYCYIQDANFFENVFNSFENGKHSKKDINRF